MRPRVPLAGLLFAGGLLGGPPSFAQAPAVDYLPYGKSGEGRTLECLRIAVPGRDAEGREPDQRPGLLIVAGLNAGHGLGMELARRIADRIASEHAELLKATTLYVVAEANPDSVARLRENGLLATEFGGVLRAGDADHDGRIAEDPGDDLDGDGAITLMRVLDPAPSTGLVAEWVADADDPRILRKPDALEGEIAHYALLVEGVDDDGDGLYNEDGYGGSAGSGTDLDRNFPAQWPELEDGAGIVPLGEAESRALVDFVLAHDNLVAALTFGPHDNLVKLPEVGKYDDTGRVPLGIEKDDEDWYTKIGKDYQERTAAKNAEPVDRRGSFHHWMYSHFGVYSFATPGWYRPEPAKKEGGEKGAGKSAGGGDEGGESKGPETVKIGDLTVEMTPDGVRAAFQSMQGLSEAEGQKLREAMNALDAGVRDRMFALMRDGAEGGGAAAPRRGGSDAPKGKKGGAEAERKWLEYFDGASRVGFHDWTAVEHPALGTVEVGGFLPGARLAPPREEWNDLVEPHVGFVAHLLELLPQLHVAAPSVERVGPGLWKVRLSLRNDGSLPTQSAMGVKARRAPPVVTLLEVDEKALVNGSKVQRFNTIAGFGAEVRAEWWVLAEDGSTLKLVVRSIFGTKEIAVKLEEVAR